MRSALLTFLSILTTYVCVGQVQQVLSFPCNGFAGKAKDAGAVFATAAAGNAVIMVLTDHVRTNYVLLDLSFAAVTQFNLPFEQTAFGLKAESYVCGTGSKGVFRMLYRNKDGDQYFLETVDFNKRSNSPTALFKVPQFHHFLSGTAVDGKLYVLTVDDETDQLGVTIVDEEGQVQQHTYDFPFPPGKETKLSKYLQGLTYLEGDAILDVATTYVPAKMYAVDGHLVVTVNTGDEMTQVFEVPEDGHAILSRIITCPNMDGAKARSNSYVFDSTLYIAGLSSSETLEICAMRVSDGTIIRELTLDKASAPGKMAETPQAESRIGPPGLLGSKSEAYSMPYIPDFYKNIKKNIAVAVHKNARGQLVITIGGYKPMPRAIQNGFDLRGNPYVNYYPPEYQPYFYELKSVRWLVDPTSFQPQQGSVGVTWHDQVLGNVFPILADPVAPAKFYLGGHVYYGNYDSMEYTYEVSEIVLQD